MIQLDKLQPVRQTAKWGGRRDYRDSKPEQELIPGEFTLTFQLMDGFINYWMMVDLMFYWYGFPNPDPFIPEGTTIRMLDLEGNQLVSAQFRNVLFKSVGSLDLSFSSNQLDFTTFECSFAYNAMIIKVELD